MRLAADTGQRSANCSNATQASTESGLKVALVIMVPALVSSMKPITDARAVPLITCTRKPTVGGTAMRSACGPTTWRIFSPKLSARLAATQADTFSPTRARPK